MAQEKLKRGRGGQPKDPAERKSGVVTLRIREQLKQGIEASARHHGRTVSEEISYRLERSFIEGRAVENLTGVVKLLLRDQGATDEQIEEMIAGYTHGSPDAAAQQPAAVRALVPAFSARPTQAAPPDGWEETMYRAVVRALRDARSAEAAPEPPTVTPEATPEQQAAWAPITAPTPNPDEPAQDGQPAKGAKSRTK